MGVPKRYHFRQSSRVLVQNIEGEVFRGVVANVLVCNIVVSEFELQFGCYIHLRTKNPWIRHELSYPTNNELNSTTLFFYKDYFRFKYPKRLICH